MVCVEVVGVFLELCVECKERRKIVLSYFMSAHKKMIAKLYSSAGTRSTARECQAGCFHHVRAKGAASENKKSTALRSFWYKKLKINTKEEELRPY